MKHIAVVLLIGVSFLVVGCGGGGGNAPSSKHKATGHVSAPGGVLHGRNAAQLADGACDTSWPTFQCNNNRNGESVNNIILPFGKKWEFTGETGIYTAPVVADSKVFVGSSNSKIYALNEMTGA